METNILLLDALIRKRCPDKLEKFVGYLEDKDTYEQTLFSENPFNPNDFSFDAYFDEIHYSWWIEPLKKFNKDASLFIEILPEEAKHPLKKILQTEEIDISIDGKLALFLKQTLLNTLGERALPTNYLPKSILNPLLSLSKKKLINLIDYLSLYDLAFELKHVVDTNILKPIFSYLSDKETLLLKKAMKTREPFSPSRMGLEKWDKEEKSLRSIMQKRGIFRLTIALSRENDDLTWHIAHRLDSGRGNLLKKSIKKEISSSIIDSIQANIIEIAEDGNL